MAVKTPRYLGVVHHPAVGIRLPEVLLTGILSAYRDCRTAGGLMLSFGRETAPEYVINAPPGKYEITMGHTGTSIRHYLTAGAEAARKMGVVVEMEADHLQVARSSAAAVKRISGAMEIARMSDEEVERALEYIRSEVDEAVDTGYVNFFTIDTCELIEYSADELKGEDLRREFRDKFGAAGDAIISRYVGKRYVFVGASGRSFAIKFSEEDVMSLALKYWRSLETTKRICDYLREKVPWQFGVEIAFDETPFITKEKDMLFYLRELWEMGLPVDYIAPNVGFEKKQDFRGDLDELERRVERLAAIARSFGCLLSFHSGSGSSPYSGKGPGVYERLLRATGRALKYKISGIYIELLLEIMSSYPRGSKPRRVYEEVYDAVIDYVKKEIERRGSLDSPALRRQLSEYERGVKEGKIDPYDPRAEVFRYYSFLALNLRDSSGERYLRRAIVETYQEQEDFRKRVDEEVYSLTCRLIYGLAFAGNLDLLS